MLDKEGISERNQKLINFISGLNLGIHIIDLPEKPRFVSKDKYLLNGYVKNFKIYLMSKEYDGEVLLECRVDADYEQLREKFVEWMTMYEHRRIYTLVYGGNEGLFVSGKDYHDKINKINSYPVFGRFSPMQYNKIESEKMQENFPEYDLTINEENGIYKLTNHGANLFVVGYNHHDLEKKQPYPVFARYFPHFYYELHKAEELVERYKEYELQIK